jgi:predicted ATPase
MIATFAVSGQRSLRDLVVPLFRLTVITRPKGSGKSSFHRALRLLSDMVDGRVVLAFAADGGLAWTLWAKLEAISRRMRVGAVPVEGTR